MPLSPLPRTSTPPPSAPGATGLAVAAVGVRANPESDSAAATFLARRLTAEASRMPAESEGAALRHLACTLADGTASRDEVGSAVVRWAGALETAGRLDDAGLAIEAALAVTPRSPDLVLHAARIARKQGAGGQALDLYRRVRSLAPERGPLRHMAAIGVALLDPHPKRALTRALGAAREAGSGEATAVAQEERARARRRRGDRDGALRDLLVAAARYAEPVDRARALHEAADLLSAAGDPLAVREVLVAALHEGRVEQRAHTLTRLHAVSRALGDEVGRRRWRGERPARLVSLAPPPPSDLAATRAVRVARNLRRLGLA